MNLVLCPSFVKQLKKLKSIQIDDVKALLRKFPNTNNIEVIDHHEEDKVLKCYLLQKKVRSIVFLMIETNLFIPVSIVKKESKTGKNITKENYSDLFEGEILKIEEEFATNNFEIEEF